MAYPLFTFPFFILDVEFCACSFEPIFRFFVPHLLRRTTRVSLAAKERKARMWASKGEKKEASQAEDVFIELPKSLRKIGDEDFGDHDGGAVERETFGGLPMVRRDAVKDKFSQLKKLEGAFEVLDVSMRWWLVTVEYLNG